VLILYFPYHRLDGCHRDAASWTIWSERRCHCAEEPLCADAASWTNATGTAARHRPATLITAIAPIQTCKEHVQQGDQRAACRAQMPQSAQTHNQTEDLYCLRWPLLGRSAVACTERLHQSAMLEQ
jgi:hypothetical protein